MAFRDDLTALSARHDALATEVARKTRELEDTRRMLDHAQARARLPVLDNIRVAAPCTADWNQMTGDDRTRHCGECKKNVYNLSGMTRDEAEALLIERNGDLCVRYFQRDDGTILLADCSVGVKRRRGRRLVAAGAATLLASGAVAGLRARQTCAEGQMRMGATSLQVLPAAIDDTPPAVDDTPPMHHEIKGKFEPATPAPHAKMGKAIRYQ
jgi:hypothetical protein